MGPTQDLNAAARRAQLCPTPLVTPGSLAMANRDVEKPKRKRSVRFADDAPFMNRCRAYTADYALTPSVPKSSPTTSRQVLTPMTLSKKGLVVRGTFLNVMPTLPTPLRKDASRRSHSVPKNMGSEKLCEEDVCSMSSMSSGDDRDCGSSEWRQCSSTPLQVPATPLMSVFPPTPWPATPLMSGSASMQVPATPLMSVFPPTPWQY